MNFVVMDYETEGVDGWTGLDYFSPGFKITSCAFQWVGGVGDGKVFYTEDLEVIRLYIKKSIDSGYSFVVHNLQFEYGCTFYVFPELVHQMKWVDTMRLVQVYDNGGKKAQRMSSGGLSLEDELAMLEGRLKTPTTGLGLVSAASRLLPTALQNHKKEAHDWLAKNADIRKNPGEHLSLLPPDVMERYNMGDVDVTLALYRFCTTYFKQIEYDWTQDHKLYTHIAKRISKAKGHGIKVNRPKLAKSIRRIKNEIMLISRAFKVEIWDEIKQYEEFRYQRWIGGCKMPHAIQKRIDACTPGSPAWNKNVRFNLNSGKQKRELFVNQMGITPKFYTKKGDEMIKDAGMTADEALKTYPSFAANHMKHYGPAGKIVSKKKKRELVLKQCENLYILSEKDGRFHHDLRAAGTATGRNKGGRHE